MREPKIGPVVTLSGAALASFGGIWTFMGIPSSMFSFGRSGVSRNVWEAFGSLRRLGLRFPSLRRHDPDQVLRDRRAAISAPHRSGTPLGPGPRL
ncbi:hypothetical protein GCM10008174_17140 [Methylopila turkensis]|uniref:Uncharacterized protein n=1 Tax=Methylopila turkensis TaxID=1437816 RepID=A0A9W6JQX8_9HYPH|nr:hypothetical protein GCM10008174_17140 [Methylopila turkensis]